MCALLFGANRSDRDAVWPRVLLEVRLRMDAAKELVSDVSLAAAAASPHPIVCILVNSNPPRNHLISFNCVSPRAWSPPWPCRQRRPSFPTFSEEKKIEKTKKTRNPPLTLPAALPALALAGAGLAGEAFFPLGEAAFLAAVFLGLGDSAFLAGDAARPLAGLLRPFFAETGSAAGAGEASRLAGFFPAALGLPAAFLPLGEAAFLGEAVSLGEAAFLVLLAAFFLLALPKKTI